MIKRLFGVAVAFSMALAGSAAAAEGDVAPEAPAPQPLAAPREMPWQVELGYRGSLVRDPGFDAFSNNDWLSEVTLAGSRVVLKRGRFSLSAGASWDHGSAGASARGADATLTLNRLSAQLSARYALGRRLYVFGTIAPGAASQVATVSDPSATAPLSKSLWVASADASAGAAYAIIDTRPVRFWLRGELGYGVTAPMALTLWPGGSINDNTASTNLGSLSMDGPFGRLAVAASF